MFGNEVKTAIKLWFHHQGAQFYCERLMNLHYCCSKCIQHKVYYMQKYL